MNAPGSDAPARSLSQRLREETRDLHEAVERASSINRLIVVEIPELPPGARPVDARRREQAVREYREVYRRFLVAAHGFEVGVDRRILDSPGSAAARAANWPLEGIDPAQLIRADLTVCFGATAADGLCACEELPRAVTLPELVGMEYVRRGSRAGGVVIAAVVRRNLGHDRDSGASFLGAHGKQTRAVVTGYKDWVDGLLLTETEKARAVESARSTFAAVERWHRRLDAAFDRD